METDVVTIDWFGVHANQSDIERASCYSTWRMSAFECVTVCDVESENVHLFDEYVCVMMLLSD